MDATHLQRSGAWSSVTISKDLDRLLFGAFDSELKTSDYEKFRSDNVFKVVKCNSGLRISSRMESNPERLRVAKASRWTLGVLDFAREVLDNLDTCHHPDTGQILTTTLRKMDPDLYPFTNRL